MREALVEELRNRILTGALSGGKPIAEGDLTSDLEVSRTPVREALIALEREGLVASSPGRGFSVIPLTADDASETYPMVGALEALALRTQGVPSLATLDGLVDLNDELVTAIGNCETTLRLDEEWHAYGM